MARRVLAVVLATLVAISTLIALAPAQAHGLSTAAAGSSQARTGALPAAITYTVLNGYGYATTEFYPGEVGWGSLYFIVTDATDQAVNVTISDPHAARDGVAAPAFHYQATLNTTTSTFNSYNAHVGYNFPASLPYGGQWTVNFSAPNGGSVQQNITLFVYYTVLSTSVGNGATLPGQDLSVLWSLYLGSNGAGFYTHATNVWITGHYMGNGTLQNFFPQGRLALTPVNTGQGTWSGAVPANATPDSQVRFQVYAITNVSGQVVENESSNVTVRVGALSVFGYTIIPSPPNCGFAKSFAFYNGSTIAACIQAGASYFGSFTPISGLPVSVAYWNGTAHVTPGGAPTALTTNSSGEAAFTFVATHPPFVLMSASLIDDALNLTVIVPGASAMYTWTQWLNVSWVLVPATTGSGLVQVSLDHTQYYEGATATASWSVGSSNLTQTGPITVTGWEVSGPNSVVYAQGVINSTAQSGTFTFGITEAMVPNLIIVSVLAENSTTGFEGVAYAIVLGPSLLLTPDSIYYTPGSTARVTAMLNGAGYAANIQYQVWAFWGFQEALLTSGSVSSGGTIQASIASNTPPTSIEIDAWATVSGQVIASNFVDLSLEQGYSILLGVTTASSYSDGSYQPGQTVTLSYQVVSVGGVALPQFATFQLITVGYPNAYMIQNVGLSGTISFTIPSNAPRGSLLIELQALGALSAAPCFPPGACIGVATIPINPSPSVLDLELGAGSGLTVGWLILLILVILVAVAFFFMLRGRGGRFGQVPASKLAPPAPAPSTESPTEWTPPPPPEPGPPPPPDSSPPGLPEPPPPPK
jgi:hypothetical protein